MTKEHVRVNTDNSWHPITPGSKLKAIFEGGFQSIITVVDCVYRSEIHIGPYFTVYFRYDDESDHMPGRMGHHEYKSSSWYKYINYDHEYSEQELLDLTDEQKARLVPGIKGAYLE